MPELQTKGVGALEFTIKNTKAAGNGAFEAVISTASVDRDGEILDPGWADPLPAEIPIHADHRVFEVEAIVGKGVPFYDGELLKVKGDYAGTELAQLCRQLVGEGMLKTMSVSYLDAVYEDEDGVPHLRSGELVEASFVSIPAQRDALVTASKSLLGKARNATKDAERLQSIHDLAVENGATCKDTDDQDDGGEDAKSVAKLAAEVATGKSIVGSYEERTDRLRDALQDKHPEAQWLWVRGTFTDRVVYTVETENDDGGSDRVTYDRTYTIGDSHTFTFGEASEVDVEVSEVVVPADETDATPGAEDDTADDGGKSGPLAVARATAVQARAALLLTE